MPPLPVTFPSRRRLTWHALLDLPVRLTPPRDTADGPARSLLLGHREPGDDGTEPGWLVMLDVSNTGWWPVHSTDFTTPLSFAFPGRQVLAVWLSPKPAARRTARPAPEPAIRLPGGTSGQRLSAGGPDRVQLAGRFLLRPADGYGITVILTGTPAAGFHHPIQLGGAFPGGRVTASPGP
jgi:hypothetical protein